MARRVLVTRPEPGASATARALRTAGFEPVVLPLTEIVPIADGGITIPGPFAAIAATSSNAIRHAPQRLVADHAALPLFAVGASTAGAAIQAGFSRVNAGPGNAEGLARLAAGRLTPGDRLLYICGRVRTPELERWLGRAGFEVVAVETYDTVVANLAPAALAALADGPPIFAAMVYSAEAALALVALESQPGMEVALGDAVHVCISARAAAPLRENGVARIEIAAEATDRALLAALSALP